MPVISHLADLFVQMEYCEASAITPNMELAKLALVTSRDEEEDEADKGGTDSSNDTDATLVEDGPSRFPVSDVSPVAQASTPPLDQSNSKEGGPGSPMIESPTEKEDYVMISQAMSRGGSESPPPLEEAGPSARLRIDGDGDIVMNDIRTVAGPLQKPPPLPTRKATVSDSVMMFGANLYFLSFLSGGTAQRDHLRPAT
jgi:ubiquitin carboxyl-terminal hydrolase 25/28